MNQGKRYIRNTVIALCGFTVLMVIAERIYSFTVDASTPQWLRSVVSLGLVVEKAPEPGVPVQMADAGQLHFTQISVDGDFTVEVVAAPVHKVSVTPADGPTAGFEVEGKQDGLLKIKGGTGTAGTVLRIETPTLTSIDAQNLRQLTIRGLKAPELTIHMKKLADVRLEECAVGRWILNSGTPVVMQADKATFSASYDIQANGEISIRGAGGEDFNFHGKGGRVSLIRKGK